MRGNIHGQKPFSSLSVISEVLSPRKSQVIPNLNFNKSEHIRNNSEQIEDFSLQNLAIDLLKQISDQIIQRITIISQQCIKTHGKFQALMMESSIETDYLTKMAEEQQSEQKTIELQEMGFTYSCATQSLILLIQIVSSLWYPAYGNFLKDLLSNMSQIFLLTALLGVTLQRSSGMSRKKIFWILIAAYSYIFIINGLLQWSLSPSGKIQDCQRIIMLTIIHPLPHLVSRLFNSNKYFKLGAASLLLCLYIFVLNNSWDEIIEKKIVEKDSFSSKTINLSNNRQYLEIFYALVYYWIDILFITDTLIFETFELSSQNSNLQLIIVDNEVHVASLIHELRNPLNSLMGAVSLLEKGQPIKDMQQKELYQVANTCCEHLSTMIGNLLEFSKLKAKKVEMNNCAIDIRENVSNIMKMNYFKAKEKEDQLQLFVSTNFPKKIITDEQRFNQILINLLANSIKFTNKGTVSVYLGWRYEYVHSKSIKGGTNNQEQTYEQLQLAYIEDRSLFNKLESQIKPNNLMSNNNAKSKFYSNQLQSHNQLNQRYNHSLLEPDGRGNFENEEILNFFRTKRGSEISTKLSRPQTKEIQVESAIIQEGNNFNDDYQTELSSLPKLVFKNNKNYDQAKNLEGLGIRRRITNEPRVRQLLKWSYEQTRF